jgi:hypothetical protein
MNTIRQLAMQWSNNLLPANKDYLMSVYYNNSGRDFSDLTGREIENIFYNEVILKWYVSKYGKIEFDYNEEEIKNIYLKEHSKEEPKNVILGYKTSLDAQMLDKIEPKQETTLEETAKKSAIEQMEAGNSAYILGFIEGAKWKSERMYSSLSELRNELYDTLPTGNLDAFELLTLIKNHLQKIDKLCGNK